MPTCGSGSWILQCAGAALLIASLLSGACNGGGSRSSPTAPPLPPTVPATTHVAGSMIDPRGDTRIGNATLEYTNPDGSAAQFTGGNFSFDIKPGTTVAVSAPGYESRTIGTTPDSEAGHYFMRYTGDARFNERFKDLALSVSSTTQRMSGTCLRGEASTRLDLQVASRGNDSTVRKALPDLAKFTRGAYDLANAPFGAVENWNPEPGVLKIVFAPEFYTQPCYPAPACTRLIGDPPQILGASIIIAADRSSGGSYFRIRLSQGLATIAGARGSSDTGGVMTPSATQFADQYDTWTFNTLYCLPIGYSPGSLTAASSTDTALPFQLDPTGPGSFAGPADARSRSRAPDPASALDRRRPRE